MISFSSRGFDALLEDKNLSAEQRRKIIVTSVAVSLIGTAVSTEGSSHKLSEEMPQLSRYVDAIEGVLGPVPARR
jgi:hypothetical protein